MKKILLVDDEPANLRLLKCILTDSYNLIFATSGAKAIDIASEHQPNLILLDVMMPNMNGYEACKELKKKAETSHIPVIFITALNDLDDESNAFNAGAADYITKPFQAQTVLNRVKTHLSLVNLDELTKIQTSAISMLAKAGHYHDESTGEHVWRMADYARIIASAYGWSSERAKLLEYAAPMHDMGKIAIPDHILKKKENLTVAEWDIMQTHTTLGFNILSSSDTDLFKLAAEIALYHHEKWDGSGYPKGLSGEAIPESARIVAIADVFDALTMKRPYKEEWPVEASVAEINRLSGTHFEPKLVEAFNNNLQDILTERESWNQKNSLPHNYL